MENADSIKIDKFNSIKVRQMIQYYSK